MKKEEQVPIRVITIPPMNQSHIAQIIDGNLRDCGDQLTPQNMASAEAIANGNPGAATVIALLIKENAKQKKASVLDMLSVISSAGLIGPELWMLFKDEYKQDIGKTYEHIITLI